MFGKLVLAAALLAAAASAQAPPRTNENLNTTLWVQHAVEYRAVALEVFRAARTALDQALKQKSWTAVPQSGKYRKLLTAIITDIDETILDNSPAQARLVASGQAYTLEGWNQWVEEAVAQPIPGALEMLRYAASRGVTVFYVSNRESTVEAATRKNLVTAGFPWRDDIDVLLTKGERPDWTSDKQSRRDFIAARYRVLLLLGDDLGDFVEGARSSLDKRQELFEMTKANWGVRWFMLPNPAYGSWEDALFNNDRTLNGEQRLERKYNLLRK